MNRRRKPESATWRCNECHTFYIVRAAAFRCCGGRGSVTKMIETEKKDAPK